MKSKQVVARVKKHLNHLHFVYSTVNTGANGRQCHKYDEECGCKKDGGCQRFGSDIEAAIPTPEVDYGKYESHGFNGTPTAPPGQPHEACIEYEDVTEQDCFCVLSSAHQQWREESA